MVEGRVQLLEVTMAQIGVELKYITEKLDKVVDSLEQLSKTKSDVNIMHEKIRILEEAQKDMGWLIFVGKYPKIGGLILAGAITMSLSELKSLFGL